MPDWLIERGIGETRAILVEDSAIVEARITLDGAVPAGTVLQAVLKQTGKPAVAADGKAEFLLPNCAPGVTQGAGFFIEVTREAIPGAEPWKRPLARVADGPARPAPGHAGEALASPPPPTASGRPAGATLWTKRAAASSGSPAASSACRRPRR